MTIEITYLMGATGTPSTLPNLSGPFSGIPTPTITFSELALDPVTWDLIIPIQVLTGVAAVVQKIRQRFRLFKGEWFLDQRLGVPYLQVILVKAPSQLLINTVFQQVLVGTPGVASVQSFKATLDKLTRALTVNFVCTLVDGSVVTAQAEPFIINLLAPSSSQAGS